LADERLFLRERIGHEISP